MRNFVAILLTSAFGLGSLAPDCTAQEPTQKIDDPEEGALPSRSKSPVANEETEVTASGHFYCGENADISIVV